MGLFGNIFGRTNKAHDMESPDEVGGTSVVKCVCARP